VGKKNKGSSALDSEMTESYKGSSLDMQVRQKMSGWDRSKFLIVILGIFLFLTVNVLSQNPLMSVVDGIAHEMGAAWWLVGLFVIEGLRQVHYLIAERSPEWNTFFSKVLFSGVNRRSATMNDWNKYRVSRALKYVGVLVALDIFLAAHYHLSVFTAIFQAPAALSASLPLILQLGFAFVFVILQFVGLFWFLSKGGIDVYFPGDVKTRFSDVWGQDAVLERIKENIIFLKEPDIIEEKGGYVPGGILLWGPPGTGKTLMAEAVAGETENPFVFVDPGAFINMFMGIGVLKVKGLFRKLRKLAVRYGGVVVFFDEADSLGSRGSLSGTGGSFNSSLASFANHVNSCNGSNYISSSSLGHIFNANRSTDEEPEARRGRLSRFVAGAGGMGGMGGGGTGTLQALLTEISGLKKPRGFFNRTVRRAFGLKPKEPPKYRMLIMMATNMPDALDEALLRPGRIDRIYRVGYPSKAGRVKTYKGYLAKVAHVLTDEEVDRLATITPYATGATIKDLVNESLIIAIRDGREVITWKDIVRAKQLKDFGPPDDVEYIERDRHAVAIHEACHAIAAITIRQHLTIDIATIEKGSNFLGLVASIPPEDQFTRWRSEYEADIMVSLASLAGERMFFDGDNSSGVSGDLESATTVATLMEGNWGMGSTISSHAISQQSGAGGARPGGRTGNKGTKESPAMLGDRIEAKLDDLYRKVRLLLEDNRNKVFAVAHALEAYKTVTGEDIRAIVNGTRGPLIDGTVYNNSDFIAKLEAYHYAALAAHKDHRTPEIALPMPANTETYVSSESTLITTEFSLDGVKPMTNPDDL
jgi:ATP-dependent Zn protease